MPSASKKLKKQSQFASQCQDPSSEEAFKGHTWKTTGLVCVAAAAISIILHLQSLNAEFAFDDARGVVSNPDVRVDTPWSELLHHDFWGTPMDQERSHKSYRPLTVATFKLTNMLYGMQPELFHLGNLVLHALACASFTWVLFDVFDDWKICLLSGILFAVHPIHTEAVCNIVGRAEVLSGLFFSLAWKSFPKSISPSTTSMTLVRYVLFLVLVLCGLLSKEQSITVMGVVVIHDTLATTRTSPLVLFKSLLTPSPLLVKQLKQGVVVVFLAAAIMYVRLLLNFGQKPVFNAQEIPAAFADSWTAALTQHYYVFFHFWQMLIPTALCHDWSHNSLALVEDLFEPRAVAFLVFYGTVLFVFLLFQGHGSSSLNVAANLGLLVTVVTFLPSSNLFFTVGFAVAERVMYLPSMGLCIFFGAVVSLLQQKVDRRLIQVSVFCILTFLAVLTVQRTADWKDNYSLHEAGYRVNPQNVKITNNLGMLKNERSRDLSLSETERNKLRQEAKHLFEKAISADTTDAAAHLNLANWFLAEGMQSEAIETLQQGLTRGDPTRTTLRICNNLAGIHYQSGRYSEAHALFEAAQAMDQHDRMAFTGMGVLYAAQKKYADALKEFSVAIKLDPYHPEAYFNRGTALFHLEQYKECLSDLRTAVRLDPNYHAARQQLKAIEEWLEKTNRRQYL